MVQGMETVVVTRHAGGWIWSYARGGQGQECPWIHSESDVDCGAWCPMFQEHNGLIVLHCGCYTRVFAIAIADGKEAGHAD